MLITKSASFPFPPTGCGGDLTAPSGSITSPNYPLAYHHFAQCFWTIRVAEGSNIQMMFVDFNLEARSNCQYDYLQVGFSASARRHAFNVPNIPNKATVTWFIGSRIRRSKWNRPIEKSNVIPPLYFKLYRRAISRYTKPTINLPRMVIKLHEYQYQSTATFQYSNAIWCWNASSYQKIILLIFKNMV